MHDKLVTVAEFATPIEARLAKNRLEAAGIPTFLGDEETVGNLWHLGLALGGVKLLVADDDIQRAMDVLATLPEQETTEADYDAASREADAEAIQEAWTCPQCGNRLSVDQRFCTACGSAGDEPDEAILVTASKPSPDSAALEDNIPLRFPMLGDEIAFRALKAAAFGLLFFPLAFYSCWLLFRLLTFPGELSPQGTRHMLLALVLDFVVLVVYFPVLFFLLV
jgi:hypothetical protein